MRIDESIEFYNSNPKNKVKLDRKALAENKEIFPKTAPKTNLGTISRWQACIDNPKATNEQVLAMANVLDVSLDYINGLSGNPKKC